MRRAITSGLTVRVALMSLAVALVALAIITVGVLQVARSQFEHLMMSHGATQAEATAMFQQTVGYVFAGAVAAAAVASIVLAALMARHLARPLRSMSAASDRLSHGDYSVRVGSSGPAEVQTVARSFNLMADSLERQERLRKDFIAGAAHELLTPLTNLQGYLEGLRDGVIAPDQAVFASLHEESERLVRLSRSLLTLADTTARTSADGVENIDLRKVIGATAELTQPLLDRRRIALALDLDGSLRVAMNPDHATQVLFNLLQNAARYTDEGGNVRVSAAEARGRVQVEVQNTGPGIEAADLGNVFDRFYRVEKSREQARGGQGLGLALVKQLVEVAGGDVGAFSENGVTRFWFSLPAAPTPVARAPGPLR
jgi:signal transduction histidine kinase